MKRSIPVLIIISLLVLGLSSCKSNGPVATSLNKAVTAASQEGMIPFKIGNNWTWKITNYDKNGNALQSHLLYEEIIRDTTINGETWYLESPNHTGNTEPPYTNMDGATYMLYNGRPVILFNSVIEDTSLPSTNANQSYLVSKNNLIQVPYGSYTCYKYQEFLRMNGETVLSENYYISPNKGVIKSESFSPDGNGGRFVAVKMELVSTNVF